jgi:hypothetical protein
MPLGQDGIPWSPYGASDPSGVGAVQVHVEPLDEHVPSRGARLPQAATAIVTRYPMRMLASQCPYRMARTVTPPQAPVRYPARPPVVEAACEAWRPTLHHDRTLFVIGER